MDRIRNEFLTFYDCHYDSIHKHIFYRTGCNAALADDLTSEVFLKAFEALPKRSPESSLKAWVYTIAKNHIIDYYRTRHPILSLDAIPDLVAVSHISADIAQQEEVNRVVQALPKLPPRYQEIITLKYINELEPDEIAQAMNISRDTVYVTLHRAVKKLQSLL